jgi:hypothetical protein
LSSNAAGSEVPEPLSVFLWSALAGAGFLRARAARRPARVGRNG